MFSNHGLILPVVILSVWIIFEICYRFLGNGKSYFRLIGWILRPWTAWAMLSVVYQMNPSRSMATVETAPGFSPDIYPFFARAWSETESFRQIVIKLLHTPTVWIWGGCVLLLAIMLLLIIKRVLSDKPLSTWKVFAMLAALYLIAGALSFSVGSLPNGVWDKGEKKGSLLSCWHAHNTVLYAVPFVKTKGNFLRNFAEIQPRLRITIHALSHPPGGALSMYYLGKVVGAGGMNIRLDSTRIRYALGLMFFAAFNVFILFFMGKSIFGSNRHGFVAAMLWMVAPSILAYTTFAQDSLYSVFFNLALLFSWKVCTDKKSSYISMISLGIVFFCLVFLNYSWCLVALIFALFLLYSAWSNKWQFRKLFLRGVLPLGVMTILSGWVLLSYKLDYLQAYKVSSEYVCQWYQFENIYQHIIAWIGGQVDLWLMMGTITCSAFFASIYLRIKKREFSPEFAFLLIILSVYVLPILFGPTCVRLETARCWMWVLSVPVSFSAHFLLQQKRPYIFVTSAVLFSLGTYTIMRLFLNFAP